MIPIEYKGKKVLITGGGRGIGLAITRAFAEAGATLIITYTSKNPSETAKAVSEEFSVPVHVYHCPGEKSEIVDEMIGKITKDVGEVDVVIANAGWLANSDLELGISLWKEAIDMTDLELLTMMQTNLFAPYYLSRALVRHWLNLPIPVSSDPTIKGKRGEKLSLNKKILFVSSISGLVAMNPQPQAAYNASKAGLTMMAKSLAGEWAQYGITVNALSPGYVNTDMITKSTPTPTEAAYSAKWQSLTPVDRFADPKEVGDLIVLMCSQRCSGFMTGSDIVFDGGYTIF